MDLSFTIYGRPVTAKNGASVFHRAGRSFHVKKPALVRWEADALKQITGRARKHYATPVNVQIRVYPYINGRCDLGGYLQAVNDILVKAGVLQDDSAWGPRIVVGHDGSRVVEVDKKNPRIEITITETL